MCETPFYIRLLEDDVYGFPTSLDILFRPPSLTFSLYSHCVARRGFVILARDGGVETILTTAKRLVQYSSLILIPLVRKQGKMQNLFKLSTFRPLIYVAVFVVISQLRKEVLFTFAYVPSLIPYLGRRGQAYKSLQLHTHLPLPLCYPPYSLIPFISSHLSPGQDIQMAQYSGLPSTYF